MKNKLFKYGKKSLSVFLSVLMLMTCWVFVPGEHNHAEAIDSATYGSYITNLVNSISLTTDVPTVYGSANGDTKTYTDSQKAELYKNVIYSPQINQNNYAIKWTHQFYGSNSNLYFFHPVTVMFYDGVTTPTMGIGAVKHIEGNNRTTFHSGRISANGQGLTMGNYYWYGAPDGSLNDGVKLYDAYYGGNTSAAMTNGTFNSTYNHQGEKQYTYFFANRLVFNTTMADNTYYLAINPTYEYCGASTANDDTATLTGTSLNTIYVINYKPLRDKITAAANILTEIKNNPNKYTYASVKRFVDLSNALLAAKPTTTNYNWNDTANAVSSYASKAKTAVDNYNAWSGLEVRKYDIQAENLFSFADWYNSESNNGNVASANVDAGSFTIAATTADGEKVTGHSDKSSRTQSFYAIPVDGGQNYTVEWTTSSTSAASNISSEVFLFFYDENNFAFNDWAAYSPDGGANGTYKATVTVPAAAKYMELRFDNNNEKNANTMTFSNIKVYKESRGTEIARQDWISGLDTRKVYTYGQTVGTLETPVRKGYHFDGWQVDTDGDGKGDYDVSSSDPILQSWPLYTKWTQKTLDIGYDNLFSLSDWYYASNGAKTNRDGAITVDLSAGTLAIDCPSAADSPDNNYCPFDYDITVEPNTEYVFVYDANVQTVSSGSNGMQVHIFLNNGTTSTSWGDFPGNGNKEVSSSSPYIYTQGVSNKNTITFNTNSYDNINIRFGTCGSVGITNTFSNIGLYKKADYDAYVKNYAKVREPFKYGDTTRLMTPPTRAGYAFDGWENADGDIITSVDGLYDSDTVYAVWTKTWKVRCIDGDGNVLKTVTVRDGESAANQLPASASKTEDDTYHYTFSGWSGSDQIITQDTDIVAAFTPVLHTCEYILMSRPTCDYNARVSKYCTNCAYNAGEIYYDGTEIEEYLATGHDYTGGTVVTGTSSGKTDADTHKIQCVRYGTCGSTKEVPHVWAQESTVGANCVTPGTVNWKCACGETKTTTGETAPDVHENTTTIGAEEATCTAPGYSGDTYCNDCKQTVANGTDIDALGHKWENTKTNLKDVATCTTDAVYYQECSVCKISAKDDTTETGTTWTDEGSKLGHKWENTERFLKSGADCENDAVYYQECSVCKISAEADTTGTGETWTKENTKWNHNFTGDYVSNNNGTHNQKCVNTGCTATGNKQNCTYGAWTTDNAVTHSHTCTLCEYTPAAENHNWSDWESTDDNNITEAGEQTRSCEICGRTETQNCNYTTTHNDATCTLPERTEYICSDCGHGYTVIGVAATGHNYTGDYNYDENTDKHQQLCANGCGTYGIGTEAGTWADCSWTYTNKEDGKHTASCVCGNSEEQNCSGGEATCTAPATCEKCETAYGEKADHSFKGAVVKLDGDVHAYLCEYCGTTDIYGVGNEVNATEACSGGTATCSDLAVCTVCGDGHGAINPDNHKWGEAENIVNTETHKYTCEYNNNHTKTEDCYAGMPGVVSPDCNTAGYTLHTCEECGHTWQTDSTAALGHKWGAWTSDENGSHTRTCERAGCKYGENGAAKTDTAACTKENATSVVTVPTCLDKGYTTYTCKDCGYAWTADEVAATGHSYTKGLRNLGDAYKRSEKTCTEAETYWYKCDNCNVSAGTEADKYADNLASIYWTNGSAAGHQWDKVVDTEDLAKYRKSEATCTASAVYYKSCTVCKESSEGTTAEATFTYLNALGHDWTNTERYLKSGSDCVNDEVYYKECSRCHISSENETGATWTKENTKSGHDLTYHEAVKATCETTGNIEYWSCSVCNKNFSDEEGTTAVSKTTTDKLGHDWVTVVAKTATCEEDGHNKYEECSRCQIKKEGYTEYKATGHNFTGAWTYDAVNNYHSRLCVNNNCLADGTKANGLVVDGKQVKYTVEYDGLDYVITGGEECDFTGEYVNTTDDDGVHSHTLKCKCGNTTSAVCKDEEPAVVAPTCTAAGYTEYICEVCGYKWQVAGEEATDHNFENVVWKSNGDGTHSRACANNCGKTETENCSTENPATTCGEQNICDTCKEAFGEIVEHTFTNYVSDKNATCTEDGTKTAICDVCKTAKDTVADKGSATGHNMSEYTYDMSGWKAPEDFSEEIKEPNCAQEGRQISYCINNCGYYKTKTVAKDKSTHVWPVDENGEEIWTSAGGDCSTGIIYKRSCELCGTVVSKKVDSVDHTWVTIAIVDPTCEEAGYTLNECSICKVTDEVAGADALGHDWKLTVTKEPTCATSGRGTKVCSICKQSVNVELAPNGHGPEYGEDGALLNSRDVIIVEATPATCDKAGYAEYWKCLNCSYDQHLDEEWLAQPGNYIAPTGHADNDGDGKCDSCKDTIYTSGSDNKTCGCICHEGNWFLRIIYKIFNFFWKLFRINPACKCGATHY